MRTYVIAVAVATLAWATIPGSAWAQFNRNGSSLGSSSMKANSAGSSMFGNRFGQSSNSAGSSLASSASSMRTGLGGATSDQMLRSARGAGNFVGADANDNRNFLGFTDANSRSAGLTRQNSLRRSTSNTNVNRQLRNSYGTGRSGGSTETVRPTLEVGFDHQGPAPDAFVPKLTSRLTKSPSLRFLKPAQVTVENGTVVLQGTVRSEHERALAEQFVLQEPGVRQVENRLTVAP